MKVLTLLNEKGGVGKTTLSAHIGAGLAQQGARVLIVDTDAQANLTSQFRVAETGGLYQLIVKEAAWRDVLTKPEVAGWSAGNPTGALYLLTSNIETRGIPLMVDDARILAERLEELEEHVDVVVIDTSPTPSLLHSMIYLASDYMIYPTQCEMLALGGVAKSVAHMTGNRSTRKAFGLVPTTLLAVQPMMFMSNTSAHQYGLEKIKAQFGAAVWAPITARTIWREASYAQQTIFAYAPESPAAADMWQVVNNVKAGMEL